MRNRLRPAADEVEIRNLLRAENPEPAEIALWRDVDVTVARKWRRADEEEALRLDPGTELASDLFVDLADRKSVLDRARRRWLAADDDDARTDRFVGCLGTQVPGGEISVMLDGSQRHERVVHGAARDPRLAQQFG